ncbi:fluoride efflux transporter CrcB [Kineosporia succinea]|uniref:Fluoride-specific ion channel FluC n=1 Tax=Kineosporia succinea TaxID=84632 RepID=A0ABT9NWD3_9ACTN|nr:fluoride efflux transporter CrcB [Kineosporia succinea]MDP9824736.1 protein CrcB [Kineosporia succinea]
MSRLRQELAVIAAGGVIGAEARYGLTRVVPASPGGVPWAVLVINVTGGFFMGVLMARLARSASPHPLVRPFLGVGILGGFTTFSTYSTDTFHLIDADRPLAAVGYVTLTLVGALLAVVLGEWAVSLVARPVARAVGAGADLAGADLAGADLAGADSVGADSAGTDSVRADSAGTPGSTGEAGPVVLPDEGADA